MSNMICDECETVFHCLRNGCIPKQSVQQQEPICAVCGYHEFSLSECKKDLVCDVCGVGMNYNTAPQPAQQDSDCVLVPRVLIGAACSAIDRKRDAPETLKQLRRYTVGDLSTTQPSQPQQEPVAWMTQARNFVHPMEFTEEEAKSYGWKAVYTAPPPARKPLTDAQVLELWERTYVQRGSTGIEFARAIEAAHGIKEDT